MTEYTETKQDREDAQAIARFDTAAAEIDALRVRLDNLADASGLYLEAQKAIRADATRVAERRARIVRECEARVAAFYTDRAKVKRALAALRKLGYVASISEPSYESALDSTPKLAEAQNAGKPWLAVSTKEWRYAFEAPRAYYGQRGEQGDTLEHSLYFSWGPTSQVGAAYEAIGHEIVAAFRAEGLEVRWDGSAARCVQVVGAADREEVNA